MANRQLPDVEIRRLIEKMKNAANIKQTAVVIQGKDDSSVDDALGLLNAKLGNSFTDAERAKLKGIAEGANNTIVSNTLESTSTSEALAAAQGKVLNEKLSALTLGFQLQKGTETLENKGSGTVWTTVKFPGGAFNSVPTVTTSIGISGWTPSLSTINHFVGIDSVTKSGFTIYWISATTADRVATLNWIAMG